jgi:hypothetical protein
MPDGRPFEVVTIRQLPTKTQNFVVRIDGRAGDGQTVAIDLITKEPTEALRRCASLEPVPAVTPSTGPRVASIELHCRDVRASYAFYREALQIRCRLEKDRLEVGDVLVLSEIPEKALDPSNFVITLAVADLAGAVARVDALPGLQSTRAHESGAILLTDPDGNQVRIVQSETQSSDDRADPAEGAPWRTAHRRGMTYELRNVTDTPKFHVQISGEGVLRPTTVKRVDGQSSIGFMGLDAFGASDQVDISWHRLEDRSDTPSTWSGIKPTANS